ncbi:MAG: hypothetical protein A2W21_13705 [Betaproteobacteria bacterium RBG_16_66_20]|nr:MAG: hypothetical protein A2W21_13705 [Betaproteobacteria bacterium RBG_16_66_20]
MPDVAAAFAYQAVGVRFEDLHHIHGTAQERLQVARHRADAAPGDGRGVEARALQIVLERHPRRRHVARRRNAQADEIAETESPLAPAADEQERIARDHLPEADQRAIRIGVMVHHHPHRPAPGDIHAAIEKFRRRLRRARRDHVADVQSFAAPEIAGERKIKRDVGNGAHVLAQREPPLAAPCRPPRAEFRIAHWCRSLPKPRSLWIVPRPSSQPGTPAHRCDRAIFAEAVAWVY